MDAVYNFVRHTVRRHGPVQQVIGATLLVGIVGANVDALLHKDAAQAFCEQHERVMVQDFNREAMGENDELPVLLSYAPTHDEVARFTPFYNPLCIVEIS